MHSRGQKGNVLLTTLLLLMILMALMNSLFTLVSMQYDLAKLRQTTHHTYTIAQAALEKHVETLNQAITSDLSYFLTQLESDMLMQLKGEEESIWYDGNELVLNGVLLAEKVAAEMKRYLKANIVGKSITYQVKGDRLDPNDVIKVKIETFNTDRYNRLLTNQLRVVVTATTENSWSLDTIARQKLEAVVAIEIPNDLVYKINEQYEFTQGKTPPLLASSMYGFSKLSIGNGSRLCVLNPSVNSDQTLEEGIWLIDRLESDHLLGGIQVDYLPRAEAMSDKGDGISAIYKMNGGRLDIAQCYVKEGSSWQPQPTIIINHGEGDTLPLTLLNSSSSDQTFRGMIISSAPVIIEGDLQVEGLLMICLPETALDEIGLYIESGTLWLTHAPEVVLEVAGGLASELMREYRQLLDALGLTDYRRSVQLSQIMTPAHNGVGKQLDYARTSVLEVDTSSIGLQVERMKKVE